MGSELTTLTELPIAESKFATGNVLASMVTTGFLPRVQVMGGNNDAVKEGKFPIGHFACITGKSLEDLTSEFVAVVLSWRPKAMQFQPEAIAFFDPSKDSFKAIQDRADNVPQSGCGYGPEYLLWLPDYEKFATFFCANITARNEAPNIHTFMRKACIFRAEVIKSKKYTWHGPKVGKCDLEVKLPAAGPMQETLEKFNNPPETEAEVVKEESRER